jgi:hypothetical protein
MPYNSAIWRYYVTEAETVSVSNGLFACEKLAALIGQLPDAVQRSSCRMATFRCMQGSEVRTRYPQQLYYYNDTGTMHLNI